MKNLKLITLSIFVLAMSFGSDLQAQQMKEKNKMVGGAEMYPSKNIVENAAKSKDHTTLVAAVTAADLAAVLQGDGPFTVFAPTNAAFSKLPAGTVETLLKAENKTMLQGILTYHVLAGDFKAADVVAAINKSNGTATFKTVNGAELKAMMDGDKVKIQDAAGNVATVTVADVDQSNGVIHVIDTVLLPGK